MSKLRERFDDLVRYLSTPRHLIGVSLFRVIAGVNVLLTYLLNYGHRHYLFGPNGVFAPHESTGAALDLYRFSTNSVSFELLYHFGLLSAFLWTLGYHTFWLTPITFVFWRALVTQGALVWDGGDNMMQIVFIYACFIQLSHRFSIHEPPASRHPSLAAVRAVLHNMGVLAVVAQLCVVYSVSGLTKVQGETWRNGTALYYALKSAEFSFPPLSDWIYRSDAVLTLICYMTVLFLVGFPFLVLLNPLTRRLAIFMGISFHLGIGVVMGLSSFATYMIAAELILVSDSEYTALVAWFKRWRERLFARGVLHPAARERERSAA